MNAPGKKNAVQSMPLLGRRGVIYAGLALLFVAVFLSIVQGLLNAFEFSHDFQWSPARVFLLRENPYQLYLDGNIDRRIIHSQIPNYAQLLYVLILPYAAMPYAAAKVAWGLTNIALAVASFSVSAGTFGLSRRQHLLGIAVFLMATPTRNAIGNGQQSLFVLAAFIFSISLVVNGPSADGAGLQIDRQRRKMLSAICAGLAYVKYSFAPSLGVAYLRTFGCRYLLLSFSPIVLGIVIFGVWTGSNLASLDFLSQPVRVAAEAVPFGAGDLLSLIQAFFPGDIRVEYAAKVLCVLLAGGVPFLMKPLAKSLEWWSFVSVASLSFVTHLGYDYVFYLLPFLWAIKHLHGLRGKAIAALVAYPWFAARALALMGVSTTVLLILGFAVNVLILYVLRCSTARH
ncbi:hypothetical protein KBY97_12735 [Synechococcus sp. ATX 2A4]|uniref:hypothetical protein n=1 Tax=Synechococcus sp. ATX 2A4 TaxID=2823727 RepID=UPI0020CF70EE|nr:hypothetical protein [Synechococcus sp. ATX 2A4]MCP9885979.1 hypothetical protein [Synechococcus sp. ATX 2A4]